MFTVNLLRVISTIFFFVGVKKFHHCDDNQSLDFDQILSLNTSRQLSGSHGQDFMSVQKFDNLILILKVAPSLLCSKVVRSVFWDF